jgi:hypothetical protein
VSALEERLEDQRSDPAEQQCQHPFDEQDVGIDQCEFELEVFTGHQVGFALGFRKSVANGLGLSFG